MSERPGLDMEDYVADELGIFHRSVSEVVVLFEPYRESVEQWLADFDPETQSWRAYSDGDERIPRAVWDAARLALGLS